MDFLQKINLIYKNKKNFMNHIKRFESFAQEEDFFQESELDTPSLSPQKGERLKGKDTVTEFVIGEENPDDDSVDSEPFYESSSDETEEKLILKVKELMKKKGQTVEDEKPSSTNESSLSITSMKRKRDTALMRKLQSKVREARRRNLLSQRPQN